MVIVNLDRTDLERKLNMQSTVGETAPDIYRISTFHAEFGIQFNQFLVKDEGPFLMHTGMRKMFATTLAAVASVIEPATLRRLAGLKPQTLALMHGSSFQGGGAAALLGLAGVLREHLGGARSQ